MEEDDILKYDKGAQAIIKIIAERMEKKNKANSEFKELCELNGYKVRVGQWKWVYFKDGYCVFDPRVIVNGVKVIPQKIHIKNSNEMIGEYVRNHGIKFPSFTWTINKDNHAIVDDTFVPNVKKIIQKAMQFEYKIFRKDYGNSLFKLDWKDVRKDFMTYTIQPNLECPKIKPIQIEGDMFSPSVNELIKYKSQLPVVQYRINWDFSISQFDYDEFHKALDICKEILIKKYGEQWKKKRMERYENKMKAITAASNNVEKEDDSLSISDKLRHKVVDKSIFDEEFELQWDDVKFYNGYYVFEPNLKSMAGRLRVEPLRKEDGRCRRSFMSILGHFNNRMPKITYRITKNFRIKINNDPDFEEALIFLAKKNKQRETEELEHKDKKLHKLCFAEAMERASSMTVEELIRNKNKYFDFLIAHQMKEYRVVPITENVAHTNSRHDEDSFIFTLKSHDGHPFIIVENINIDRASMVFKTRAERYEEALYAVFEYVQSDRINKRSFVRGGALDFKNSGVVQCKSIDHDDEWKRRMCQLFK